MFGTRRGCCGYSPFLKQIEFSFVAVAIVVALLLQVGLLNRRKAEVDRDITLSHRLLRIFLLLEGDNGHSATLWHSARHVLRDEAPLNGAEDGDNHLQNLGFCHIRSQPSQLDALRIWNRFVVLLLFGSCFGHYGLQVKGSFLWLAYACTLTRFGLLPLVLLQVLHAGFQLCNL